MQKCDHCGLEYEDSHFIVEEIDGKSYRFCCNGCQGVFHLLNSSNLDSFYRLKGEHKLSPPQENLPDSSRFDSEVFAKKFVRIHEGKAEISLVLEGIHCAACVWLNEKVLDRQKGVIEANINFTNHKAKIIYDPNLVKLSEIIDTIRSIGYDATPYDPAVAEIRAEKEKKDYYTRLVVAIFASMNVMWLAIARYLGYFSGIDQDLVEAIYVAEFLLATPTLFYSGWIFFRGGYYGLRNGFVTMDLLVSVGASLTWSYSIYAAIFAKMEPYFDSVTMIITFVLIGKFLEVRAKKSAVDTLDSLLAIAPSEVLLIRDGKKKLVSLEEVEIGDIIEVKAGERVVFDSVVISGEAALDTATLTGESVPTLVQKGDKVLGGVLNTDGLLQLEVSKNYNDSTFRTIVTLLEDSLSKKPNIENMANRLSQYFSSTILSIAFLTFLVWIFGVNAGFDRALMVAVSVVIIACPCALALATPIATVVGTSLAARKFILFKATKHLETMAKAKWLLLDKTGTLTEGKPQVIRAEIERADQEKLLALVKSSTHPISLGVASYLENHGIKQANLSEIRQIAGKGLIADNLIGGNRAFLLENGIEADQDANFYFVENGKICASFWLEDKIRPNAKEAVDRLKKLGLNLAILTGDQKQTAQKVANELGIDQVHSELLPQEKADLVKEYQEDGIVVMVGDGVNDALALANAEIAIAMHSGADTAIAVSDVILLRDSIEDLATSFAISQKTYRAIKENIAISFAYNSLTVPLAVLGFVIPLIAAIAMSLSSLFVVGNSFRIKRVGR